MTDKMVTIEVSNTYVCGRESGEWVEIPGPEPGQDLADWWENGEAHDHTGDGHPCGAREHALYEVRIVAAPGRPGLVGESMSWEG